MSTLRSESATTDGPSGSPQHKYWAFVSYSHADRKWADWLHRSLEIFRVPKRLRAQRVDTQALPRRLFPLFIDRAELPVAADLHQNVKTALEESKYLIVICSPHSAVSRWVNEEVRLFKAMGRENRILCLIVGGEPNAADKGLPPDSECFGTALKFRVRQDGTITEERVEPIAADVRPGMGSRRDAQLKIAAGLLGVSFDSLKQREQERRTRQLAGLAGILSTAAVVFCLLALSALRGQDEARRAYSNSLLNQAVGLIEQDKTAEAVAYLAQSVRLSKDNLLPRTMLLAQLDGAGTVSEYLPAMSVWGWRLSRDKRTLAVRSDPMTIRCIDPLTGQAMGTALQMLDTVRSFSMSGNGECLFAATRCSIAVASTAKPMRAATTAPEPSQGESWSASGVSDDGSCVLVCASDTTSYMIRRARVWTTSRDTLYSAQVPCLADARDAYLTADGNVVFLTERVVELWNPRTQQHAWSRPLGSSEAELTPSPDGRTLALSVGKRTREPGMMGMRLQGPGTISVLDIATGELLYSRGTTGYPRPQFSPDSRLLMTDSRNDPVLDARTGAIVFRPPNDFGFFTEFSGSSRYLASEGEAGSLHVADLGNGKTLVIPAAAVSGGYAVTRLGWLFSCAGEDLLKVWDAASGRAGALGSTLQFRPAAIVPLADGVSAMIVAYPRRPSGPACELQFWRLQSPRKCAQVGARRRTYDAVFSPDGKKLALMTCGALSETCHYDTCDRLDVLDLHQGTGVRSSIVQHDGIQFARWCAEGQRLVVVSDTGRTSVYEASTGEFVPVPGLGDHKAEYAEVDSTGRWLMIAGEGSFSVWDLNDGLCKVSPEACGRRIRAATLSRDGRSVVLTCSSAVFVYEAEKGRLLVEDRRGRRCYPDAVLSQNGSRIVVYASTSDTDTVHTWDANTGKLLGSKPVRRVRTVCLSPDGRRLATMTFDDSLQIWAADFSSLILGPVKASGQWIALFTRSGRLLLQARGDGTVAAWDARTGLPCGQPIPCAGQTPKFVRHRRDEWLFVSRDSSVYLVDIRTGLALAGPFSADGKVDWLRYTPGGDWLAVAGTNGSVRLYDVSICNRSPDHRLPDLAEAIVGMRMGPLGGPEEAPHASDTRTSLRAFYGMKKDPYSRWAFSLLGGEPDPVQPHR